MEKRLSPDELATELADAAKLVTVGGVYMHYKSMFYKVVSLAILETTNEIAVIYQAKYDSRLTFIRPVQSWIEEVERDGKQVKRFTKV